MFRTSIRVLASIGCAAGALAVALALGFARESPVAVVVAAAGGIAVGLGAMALRRASSPAAEAAQEVVAHRMTSPLAALRSNLEWLRDALDAGRLQAPPEDAREAREVLDDARQAAEALRADVGALRAAVRPSSGKPDR